MKARILFIIFVAVALFSCQDELLNQNKSADKNLLLNTESDCYEMIIDFEQFENAFTENYAIDTAYIQGDSLLVTVRYSGGCGTTNFELVSHGYFMESYPVQLNVLLDMEHNDPCEALIQQTICFDLTSLATHYNQSYLSNGGTIIMHLEKYEEAMIYEF